MEYFLFALSCTLSQKKKNQVDHLSVWKEQRQRECKESKKYPPPPTVSQKKYIIFLPSSRSGKEAMWCPRHSQPTHPPIPLLLHSIQWTCTWQYLFCFWKQRTNFKHETSRQAYPRLQDFSAFIQGVVRHLQITNLEFENFLLWQVDQI